MSTCCAERPADQASDQAAAAAGVYRLDPAGCDLEVSVRFGLVTVRGRFTDATGTLDVAEQPGASRVSVSVVTASLTSGSSTMDGLLHGARLIDPGRNPELEFTADALSCPALLGAADRAVGSTVTGTLRTATGSLPLTLQVAGGELADDGTLRVTAAGSLPTADAVGLLSVPGVERVLGRKMQLRLTLSAQPVGAPGGAAAAGEAAAAAEAASAAKAEAAGPALAMAAA